MWITHCMGAAQFVKKRKLVTQCVCGGRGGERSGYENCLERNGRRHLGLFTWSTNFSQTIRLQGSFYLLFSREKTHAKYLTFSLGFWIEKKKETVPNFWPDNSREKCLNDISSMDRCMSSIHYAPSFTTKTSMNFASLLTGRHIFQNCTSIKFPFGIVEV